MASLDRLEGERKGWQQRNLRSVKKYQMTLLIFLYGLKLIQDEKLRGKSQLFMLQWLSKRKCKINDKEEDEGE